MNLTLTRPVLQMHYAPGLLAVLRQRPCPNHRLGRQHLCEGGPVFTIAGVHLLQGDEQGWCLERSWIPAP